MNEDHHISTMPEVEIVSVPMMPIQIFFACYSFWYHLVRKMVRQIKLNRIFRVHTSYVALLGTPLFLPCCLFPMLLLADSFSHSLHTFNIVLKVIQ